MIKVLRNAYPQAHIAWVVEPPARDLLRHNAALDEVICWPKTRWKQLLKQGRFIALAREVRRFADEMRLRGFDIALDGQGLLKSRILAWLSGARDRVGFDSREPGRSLMTKIISRGPNDKRTSSEYYYLMQVLGLSPAEFRPDVTISPEDQKAAENKIRGAGIGARYGVICPFTTRPQKHWFEERWAALSVALEERLRLPVAVLGGSGDVDDSRRIRSLVQGKIHDLTGTTTLGQSAAIIKNASLVVGVDTGLTHMGVAFDRPTIALFGATCPYLYAASANTIVLYESLPCSPCRRKPTCNGDFTCMKLIGVEEVFNAAESVLKRLQAQQCASYT